MAKAKAASGDTDAPKIIHIKRGGWDIDPANVVDVIDQGDEVIVVTSGQGSYKLTREEAEPFLEK